MGELDPRGLLVVTRSVSPREPGDSSPERSHLFRVELGVEAPEPMAPAAAVIATAAGREALVCWPPTEEPLDVTGWVFAGRPAAAVVPVPDEPGCALVFRDLAAIDVTEALLVEGPIPGVGRALVTVDAAPHDPVFGVSSAGAIFGDEVVTDALGLPLRYRATRGETHPDATGAGAWVATLREDTYGATLELPDGTWLEALQPTPEAPVAAAVTIGQPLVGGGVALTYRDGSVVEQAAVRPDGTPLSVTLPPSYRPFGGGALCMLGSGRVCMLYADGLHCARPDGTETVIAVSLPTGEAATGCQEIAEGIVVAYAPFGPGYVVVDVDAEGTLTSGPEELRSLRWVAGDLVTPLLDGRWVRLTPTGLEDLEIPGLTPALPILDLAATDDVWIVSTATADLRVPRR